MKIVIAPDSFKGSASAVVVARAIERGVKHAFPKAETIVAPVADGGEGMLDCLVTATNGKKIEATVKGPLGTPLKAYYGVLGDQVTCVIELASASGLHTIKRNERNPLITTTYGTGQLIKEALNQGYRRFIVGLGGSATNDGGAGLLQALGAKMLTHGSKEIGFGGGELQHVHQICLQQFDERIQESTFLIASDVDHPLVGENGASFVFGPQKGASPSIVQKLDKNLIHWAHLVERKTGVRLHDRAGAGAAGGVGGALQAFFPYVKRRGIDVVIEYIHLEEKLNGADLVITGEGKVDVQTAAGKAPFGVAQTAKRLHVPTIILAGTVAHQVDFLYSSGVISVHSILTKPMSREEAMEQTVQLLEYSAEQAVRTYFARRCERHQ